MDIATGAASSAISEIGKGLWSIAAIRIGYLLFYDRKVEKLKRIVEKLKPKKEDIRREVDAALIRGESIREEVKQWLKDLDAVEEDTKRMVEGVKDTRCCTGCRLDLTSGYKLGKEASEKISTANELLSNSNFTVVSHDPPPPSIDSLFPTDDFQASSSTQSSTDLIWQAVENDEYHIIGVYGMAGVGKTTLMKEVAKRAKKEGQFDKVIMVTVSQNQDVKRIQTEIAEQLGLKLTVESETVRAAELRTRMKEVRRILIILDDLWGRLDISKVGIPVANEKEDCKVVITSRSREVCSIMECQAHIKVEPLSEKDSWGLFASKAGDVVKKPYLRKVAMDVAKECDGLPLAIVTLGRAMRDKHDISTWTSVLNELRQSIQTHIKGMEEVVVRCIKRSFDFLSCDEARLCLLLCCLFPEDYEIDPLVLFRYVVGEGFLRYVNSMEEAWNRVCRLLEELKESCLLLDCEDPGRIKMHDVVRDVAIWISSDKTYGFYAGAGRGLNRWPESREVEECQSISVMRNPIQVLPEQPMCPKLRTLIMRDLWASRIPDRFFQGMKGLLTLDLMGGILVSLPMSVPCLVNLRVLFLSTRSGDRFEMASLSFIGELKKLEILHLMGFKFDGLPEEFGNLTSLRCLDLRECRGRIQPNLISRLSRLEQLYLTDFFRKWRVNGIGEENCADFAEVASLSCLTTLHVETENADIMQQDYDYGPWNSLSHFSIRIGGGGDRMADSDSDHWKTLLKVQDLTGSVESAIHRMRSSSFLMRPNELLIENRISKWANNLLMKTYMLRLADVSGVEYLFSAKLSKIVILMIAKMPDLKLFWTESYPPPQNGSVEAVSDADDCQKESQDGIMFLPQLECIVLVDLPELKSIWDGIFMLQGSLQNLQVLGVGNCRRLKNILPPILPFPSAVKTFPNLKEIDIIRCHSLTSLFSWGHVKGLPNLNELRIEDCEMMQSVIVKEVEEAGPTDDEENVFPSLKLMEMKDLPMLTSFLDGEHPKLLSLKSLKKLWAENCPKLKKLPLLPNLQIFLGKDFEWFEGLEWEDDSIARANFQFLGGLGIDFGIDIHCWVREK